MSEQRDDAQIERDLRRWVDREVTSIATMSEVRALLRQLDAARADATDLQRTFDLQRAADQRAVARWRTAAPGRELTFPDRTNLVVWLLEQLNAAEAESAAKPLMPHLDLETAMLRIEDYRRLVTKAMLEQERWDQMALKDYVRRKARDLGDWFREQGVTLVGFPTYGGEGR